MPEEKLDKEIDGPEAEVRDLIAQLDDDPRSMSELKLQLQESFKEQHDLYVRAADVIANKIATEPKGSPRLAEMLQKQKIILETINLTNKVVG